MAIIPPSESTKYSKTNSFPYKRQNSCFSEYSSNWYGPQPLIPLNVQAGPRLLTGRVVPPAQQGVPLLAALSYAANA